MMQILTFVVLEKEKDRIRCEAAMQQQNCGNAVTPGSSLNYWMQSVCDGALETF